MLFIGITGGVGTGKSQVLKTLATRKDSRVLLADEVAHLLMKKGQKCYDAICDAFSGADLLDDAGEFDKEKMAKFIFSDPDKRETVNSIVHPAVKQYVLQAVEEARKHSNIQFFFFEAALLLEEHYDAICDELWYIYTDREIRRARLKENRGYSDEKITSIFENQKTDEEFMAVCKEKIDNNGTPEDLQFEISELIRRKIHE